MRRGTVAALVVLGGCDTSQDEGAEQVTEVAPPDHGEALSPDDASVLAVDRFSQERASDLSVPDPGEPIDFDADYYEVGLGPDGAEAAYYGLGGSSGFTMPVYQLVDANDAPIADQLPIVDALPGENAYSDFWQLVLVRVPAGYVANTITSADEVLATDYERVPTVEVHNRPLVPPGSVAALASDAGAPTLAWYGDDVVHALAFDEAPVRVRGSLVDYAAIYVCLAESGDFCADDDGNTHNVVAAVPGQDGYSPLWKIWRYDVGVFDDVMDLPSAQAADAETVTGLVNCPLVEW